MLESVLPIFSSKSFIVSGLIFRSLIHFEFIFVYGVRNYFVYGVLLLHNKRNYKQGEKTAFRMGENNSK